MCQLPGHPGFKGQSCPEDLSPLSNNPALCADSSPQRPLPPQGEPPLSCPLPRACADPPPPSTCPGDQAGQAVSAGTGFPLQPAGPRAGGNTAGWLPFRCSGPSGAQPAPSKCPLDSTQAADLLAQVTSWPAHCRLPAQTLSISGHSLFDASSPRSLKRARTGQPLLSPDPPVPNSWPASPTQPTLRSFSGSDGAWTCLAWSSGSQLKRC